jgi:hypothetical protein
MNLNSSFGLNLYKEKHFYKGLIRNFGLIEILSETALMLKSLSPCASKKAVLFFQVEFIPGVTKVTD